jgi:hypothetical protein
MIACSVLHVIGIPINRIGAKNFKHNSKESDHKTKLKYLQSR